MWPEYETLAPGAPDLEVSMARWLMMVMKPCIMVMIMIMVTIMWLVNLVMPSIIHWIQGCQGDPDDDQDDEDPVSYTHLTLPTKA